MANTWDSNLEQDIKDFHFMHCPNCKAGLEIIDFYQDPVIFDRYYQTWYYACPNCKKKYTYTEIFILFDSEMEEEK